METFVVNVRTVSVMTGTAASIQTVIVTWHNSVVFVFNRSTGVRVSSGINSAVARTVSPRHGMDLLRHVPSFTWGWTRRLIELIPPRFNWSRSKNYRKSGSERAATYSAEFELVIRVSKGKWLQLNWSTSASIQQDTALRWVQSTQRQPSSFFLSSWWLFPTVQLLLLPSVMSSNDYKTLNFPPNYRQKLLECSRCTPSPNCPLLMLVIKHQLNIISCGISRRSDLTSRFDPAGSSHGKCPLVNWRILMLRDQSNDTKL